MRASTGSLRASMQVNSMLVKAHNNLLPQGPLAKHLRPRMQAWSPALCSSKISARVAEPCLVKDLQRCSYYLGRLSQAVMGDAGC